jgi:hypothetical protein
LCEDGHEGAEYALWDLVAQVDDDRAAGHQRAFGRLVSRRWQHAPSTVKEITGAPRRTFHGWATTHAADSSVIRRCEWQILVSSASLLCEGMS